MPKNEERNHGQYILSSITQDEGEEEEKLWQNKKTEKW